MNPTIQRYLPPALVFGVALYFGWPPAEPLDLGEDLVRASSVRWRPQDLAETPFIEPAADPFAEVLVAGDAADVESETVEVAAIPAGPDAETIQAGLRVDGIAKMGNQLWAVLNGRPRLAGAGTDRVLLAPADPGSAPNPEDRARRHRRCACHRRIGHGVARRVRLLARR